MTDEEKISSRSDALKKAAKVVEEIVHNANQEYGNLNTPYYQVSKRTSGPTEDRPGYWVLKVEIRGWSFRKPEQLKKLFDYLEEHGLDTWYITQDKPIHFTLKYRGEEEIE